MNRFFVHTDLPTNSGGSGDPARRYQYQAQFEGAEWLPTTDRIYKNPETGRYFKVRAGRRKDLEAKSSRVLALGSTVIELTVSQCDENGYALPHDRLGFTIAPPHTMTNPGDNPTAVEVELEKQRLIQCAVAELAVVNEEALAAIPVREYAPDAE
ncbi:MAG: hypothetical protein NW206_19835 [Hyphomonadaceae bacterium]|nr:hypothetical protein [Hyphomonadaceae bacterium]